MLVGWWLAAVWTAATWFAFVSVVGAPVGIKLLDGLPTVRTLKDRGLLPPSAFDPVRRPSQEPIVVRAVYFLLVGWWLGAVWAMVGYALTLTVVATPFGSRMLAKLPYVVSLFRY